MTNIQLEKKLEIPNEFYEKAKTYYNKQLDVPDNLRFIRNAEKDHILELFIAIWFYLMALRKEDIKEYYEIATLIIQYKPTKEELSNVLFMGGLELCRQNIMKDKKIKLVKINLN